MPATLRAVEGDLSPLEPGLKEIFSGFKKIMTIEINYSDEPDAPLINDFLCMIAFGASPRASIYLVMAARAHAFLQGRGYVTPEDIKELAPDVLRHRLIPTYEAEAQEVTMGDIVQRILDHVEVPLAAGG